jgi:hypothetical protein
MKDVWACGQCRSINQPRDKRCYNCHTPRTVAGIDPLKLSVTDRAPIAAGPIGTYVATTGVALLASMLVIVAVAASVVGTVVEIQTVQRLLDGARPSLTAGGLTSLVLIQIGAVILAVLAWAVWISRVVANLPALDLGYSVFTPRIVFFESLIPFYNVRRVHGVVSDILRRTHPSPRDQVVILGAWFPLVATFAISFTSWRISLGFGSAAIRLVIVMTEISLGLQIVAGMFLVALIWRIEGRMRRRAHELRTDRS